MPQTVTERAAKVGVRLTKIHSRPTADGRRMFVTANGKRMTWADMLALLSQKESTK